MNISFIGYGNMAKAIARGLNQLKDYTISASAPSLAFGINQDNIHTHHDNKAVIKNAEIIILAVKPGQMSTVLKEIALSIPPDCLLISIAAGLSLSWFSSYCCKNQAIIRAMPNTPASIGLGATPMIANKYTTTDQKHSAEIIFSHLGITAWAVKEEDMNTFTALSGSGPAYVFSFIEAMTHAAVTMGLEETVAKNFAIQTVTGAVKLAQNSDLSLIQLRTKVTSPGGTTAAALEILHDRLDVLILKAMHAAKRRAGELGFIE